jgi:transposase
VSVPLVATALVAAVSNARQFKGGRELKRPAWPVPRQQSMLLSIRRRGGRYLRTPAIHGVLAASPGGPQTRRAQHLSESA